MAHITFNHCLVLDTRYGQSKAGNPYCALQFLDEENLQVYDMMQFGDSASAAAGLGRGVRVVLGFDVVPARDGGIRGELTEVAAVAG